MTSTRTGAGYGGVLQISSDTVASSGKIGHRLFIVNIGSYQVARFQKGYIFVTLLDALKLAITPTT